jgi:hypothetical protein
MLSKHVKRKSECESVKIIVVIASIPLKAQFYPEADVAGTIMHPDIYP